MDIVNHLTKSGDRLRLEAHPHGAPWSNVGGVYVFCHSPSPGNWSPHYTGQTNSFQNRIPTHEQWAPARRLGATHVLAAVIPLQADRNRIEADLIAEWQPPLNTQLK